MGWFVPLISLAVSAAGTGLSVAGAAETASNENKAAQQVLDEQNAIQKRSTAAFNQSVGQTNQASEQQQAAATAQKDAQAYQALQQAPGTVTAGAAPGQASNPTSNDPVIAARTGAAIGQQQQAGAALQGTSQWQTDQAVKNLLAGANLNVLSGEAASAGRTLGPLMTQAQQSGQGLAGIGSILSTLGTVGGTIGGINNNWVNPNAGTTPGPYAPSTMGVSPVAPGGYTWDPNTASFVLRPQGPPTFGGMPL